MVLSTNRTSLIISFFCFSLASSLYGAEQVEQTQQELDSINSAISEISNWLDDASDRQSSAEQQLREAELEVTRVSQAISVLENTVAERETELSNLQAQQATLRSNIETGQTLLSQAIRMAYLSNDQNFVKILLNQEDISESSRMLHYSRVFSDSQINKIESYRNSLNELERVNESLAVTFNELNTQQQQLLSEAEALNDAKENRAGALSALNQDIATRNDELASLESSQAELAALLEEIRRAMEGVTSFADVPPFADERGSLPFPLEGSIATRFGSAYGDGNLIRQGITITAPIGSQVQGVHAGRVVFSDWLRGSGLLVIVDHGNGYMSLYGRNQTLALPAGEWVDVGDTIATSGDGGSSGNAGLYFEIRYRGEAQNPQNWLR
ncbi:MAG: peptidoglycan DD-metalloendopeptidase family protein [Pseudomonadales bacterium]|nr:peptidoglycan DD-metalloendopeptidase family protein [Pseudomonadales bacterium]